MDRAWLARQLYEMEITPPPITEDLRACWLNFTCDLEVVGEVLNTFVEDVDAAVIVRDRLCGWARIWSECHPEPGCRPWYLAVAGAADAGDWETVSELCLKLIEVEQQRKDLA
jgi:hypothetical protein